MTRRSRTLLGLSALALLASAPAGCAGTQAAASSETAETPNAQRGTEERSSCLADEAHLRAGDASEVDGAGDGPRGGLEGAAPAPPALDVDLQPETEREHAVPHERPTTSATVAWYEEQAASLGALACALDALECGSARQLADQVCLLAARICALEPDEPRCVDARARCERARARVRAQCPPTTPRAPSPKRAGPVRRGGRG